MMKHSTTVLIIIGLQCLLHFTSSITVSPVLVGRASSASVRDRNRLTVPAEVTQIERRDFSEKATLTAPLRCRINAQCSISGQQCCEAFLGHTPGVCYDPTVSACCTLDGSIIPLNLTSNNGECCTFSSKTNKAITCPPPNSPTLNRCILDNECTSTCTQKSDCSGSDGCCVAPSELSGAGSCFTQSSEVCCFDGRVCSTSTCEIPSGGQCCSVNVSTGDFTFCPSTSHCGIFNGSLQCLSSNGTVASNVGLDTSSSSSSNHLGLILGIVLPISAMIIVAIVVIVILLRKKKDRPTQKIVEPTVPPAYKASSAAPMLPNAVAVGGYEHFSSNGTTAANMPPGYFSAVDMGGYVTMDGNGNGAQGLYSFISTLDAHTAIEWTEIQMMQSIGQGSFGEVFKSRWHAAFVAVKKIHPELLSNTDAVNNFYREADILKKLKPHPNTVLFFGITKEPVALIMEFCENGSLYQYLHSPVEIPLISKRKFLLGIAKGMVHLHFYNIIHRDLAARNILLTGNFDVKVSDFGFSRFGGQLENRIRTPVGPVNWFPPEALRDQVFSSKTDVWSFGVVVWEVITRKDPFENKTSTDVLNGVANGGLTLEIPDNCPADLANLMGMCFQQSPTERPSFEDIVAILEQDQTPLLSA